MSPQAAPQAADVEFEFGVYGLPTLPSDLDQAVGEAAKAAPRFRVGQGEPAAPSDELLVFVTRVDDVAASYAPPDPGSIELFGRGLSDRQREALERSRDAVRLRFRIPRTRSLEGLRGACTLVLHVARRSEGLVWDEETREVFSPEAWSAHRIEPWIAGEVPNVARHITIHSYREEKYLRAITLGMAKFALPDLVVEDFASSNGRQVGHLINLTAQALAEGASAGEGRGLTLRVADVRQPEVRKDHQESLLPNATGEATVTFRAARRDEGDPDNALLEIGFDRYWGPDPRARQDALFKALFGWNDGITPVDHDEALLDASRRAREKLPAMKAIVDGGLQPGQLLMVKAPFRKPDGADEWMWVEVVAWRAGRIHGVLANEPFEVPDLHAGQDVVVSEADVFDYLLKNPDGSEQGNETGRMIEARSKAEASR